MAIANTRPGGYPASATAPPSGAGVSLQASAVSWSQTDSSWIGRQFGRPYGAGGSKNDSPPWLSRHADRGWISGQISPAVWTDCSTAVGASAPKVNPAAIRPVGMAAMFSLSANSGPALPRRARCGNPGVDLESQLSNGPQARVRVDGVGNHRLAVRP